MRNFIKLSAFLIVIAGAFLIFQACRVNGPQITENKFDVKDLNSFVESSFPFITVPLDAENLGRTFPENNVTARGLALSLGNNAYACFDMDLLRWSVAWDSAFLPMVLPAQVSYRDFFKKNNNELPYVIGKPRMATGVMPGWSAGKPVLKESRGQSQNTEGFFWGPLSDSVAHWNGVYVYNQSAILSYSVNGSEIYELPGTVQQDGIVAFTRTFELARSKEKLFINVAEVANGKGGKGGSNSGHIYQDGNGDSITVVSIKGAGGLTKVIDDRFMVVELPAAESTRKFSVLMWKGLSKDRPKFDALVAKFQSNIPDFKNGGRARWKETVMTQGKLSPDTAAFVTDVLTLPFPNPWRRNIRVADISFFNGDKAAVSTYEGDVWIVEGITTHLNRLKWRRFASGFYEPMSIEVVKGQVYVYAKEGIVRLNDLNGDGEADYYENFCNLMQQSPGTREWAADMVADREGNFYIAKGGHVTSFKGVLPYLSGDEYKGKWRASTNHSGSILKISADGKSAEVWATGLRMPYIGLNRSKNILTASDQQGNFVPATPIYEVQKGDYFGVPITKHRGENPEIVTPLTWIPHKVDRSGTSQTWIENGKMGPLNNQMIHFSFGRPGAFRVLIDSTSKGSQGGVAYISVAYPAPVLKGEVNPLDGQLYMTGFNNFASNSTGISALIRMRYTGKPSYNISGFKAGDKGIVLSFDSKVAQYKLTSNNFQVKRWNYKRTEAYGSGHFKLNDEPGEELLNVQSVHTSRDGRSILLMVPGMKPADQTEIMFSLNSKVPKESWEGLWLTIKELSNLNLAGFNLTEADLIVRADTVSTSKSQTIRPSIGRGEALFHNVGCIGCHSTGNKTEGMYGPPFQGVYGKVRYFEDGTSFKANDAYFRESILDPAKKVVKGYSAEMPSFAGVLSETDVESVILYIKSLTRSE